MMMFNKPQELGHKYDRKPLKLTSTPYFYSFISPFYSPSLFSPLYLSLSSVSPLRHQPYWALPVGFNHVILILVRFIHVGLSPLGFLLKC